MGWSKGAVVALLLMAGCATGASHRSGHDVRVVDADNPFLQTREVSAWSIPWRAGRTGDRWPVGLSLNARVIVDADGARHRFLGLRSDVLSRDPDSVVHERIRSERARLREQCTRMRLVLDGRVLELPVTSVRIRMLANRERMPVPVTDVTPDLLEFMVAGNPPDQVVVSTLLEAGVPPDVWRQLRSVDAFEYDLCGQTGMAREAELEALREVIGGNASRDSAGPR